MAKQLFIEGTCASGFESIRDVFQENFTKRSEIGAACCVYYQGEKVVDLWGGYRDIYRKELWEENTLVPVFSTTKGLASLAFALAHSRGHYQYDEPVANYWEDFAQNGKQDVTIRQLLSHQAGLAVIDVPLNIEKLADETTLTKILAQQKPAWNPGDHHGYHIFSLGMYENEIMKRIDPQGRTLGQYFHDEIATPLGLAFYIGLPKAIPSARVAQVKEQEPTQYLFNLHKIPPRALLAILNPQSLTMRAVSNPILASINSEQMHRLAFPSMSGIGLVRDIAKAYSEFATGGKFLGLKTETLEALYHPAKTPKHGDFDLILKTPTTFSLGFIKPSKQKPYGSSLAFGHSGAGGSFGFADPTYQLAFAYGMNRMDYYLYDDPRERALRQAMYRSLGITKF